jgi:hypothetical protein
MQDELLNSSTRNRTMNTDPKFHSTQSLWPLALIAATTVLAVTSTAQAAGKGGGGNTEIHLARISFGSGDAIRSDGTACMDSEGAWDYWDWRDGALPDDCEGGSTSDVSAGGRLHFGSINLQGTSGPSSSPRWLVLDFGDLVPGTANSDIDPLNPDIDALYEGGIADPPYDPTPGIDNVKTFVILENMFKSGATQNFLVITIRYCDDPDDCAAVPTGFELRWVELLSIVQDPDDPDVRTLTTDGTSALADLFLDHDLRTPPIRVGRYVMPVHWSMRLVPAP